MVAVGPSLGAGRSPFLCLVKGLEHQMISIRRVTLGSGCRYLMESVAAGDGAGQISLALAAYYAESGTPQGVFLGDDLPALDDGRRSRDRHAGQ